MIEITRKHYTYSLVLDLLLRFLPNNEKLNIVDYGCGDGMLLNFLQEAGIEKYTGFDINKDSIRAAKLKFKNKKNIEFMSIDSGIVPSLGQKNSIDAVVLVGVLQYMEWKEIENLLIESRKALKKNGIFIASCTVDHGIYKSLNFYRWFLPNYFIKRQKLVNQIYDCGFEVIYQKEKGILFTPFFSNILVFFFDGLDKLIFRTKGSLGPIGKFFRNFFNPIFNLEFLLPLDYGYTLYLVVKK